MQNSKSTPKFYRKARKLLRDPRAFFRDSSAFQNPTVERIVSWFDRSPAPEQSVAGSASADRGVPDEPSLRESPRRRAVAFHVGTPWRPAVSEILSEYSIRYVRLHKNEPLAAEEASAIKLEAAKHPDLVFLVWGYFEPPGTLELARSLGCEVHRFEDSFIRSVGLGGEVDAWGRTNWPLSLVLDTKGMYFNAERPSDIEHLLTTFDFGAHPELMQRARRCIARIVDERVTKYNGTRRVDARTLYGEKTKRRVLVLGQVESDASIRYGCSFDVSNVDLVLTAVRENPDAEVIFKPHPAVMSGAKGVASDPRTWPECAVYCARKLVCRTRWKPSITCT